MDYSFKSNWLFRPRKEKRIKDTDVFYVYPTVYIHSKKSKRHHMNVYNPFYRFLARIVSWWQVQPFAHSCNVFVPCYRQVGLESLEMTEQQFFHEARMPYEDVRAAFLYYMKYLNEGRPFVLAGHSQGSAMLQELLRREFGKGKYDKQFVAAYLPGFSLVHDDFIIFPHLKLAKHADDLGVIISYNTSAKGLRRMRVIRKNALCVNPVSWSLSQDHAPKSLNEASVLFEYKKFSISKKQFTGAYVDKKKGTLMIDDDAFYELLHIRIGFLNWILMNKRSLHMLDIALFHRNLQHNVQKRIAKFCELHQIPQTNTDDKNK